MINKKVNFFSLFLYICISLTFPVTGFGQPYFPNIKPLYPLNIPMSISGSFGDLRSNSLHFGIDFKTQSKTGFPVFAIDTGYISRIKIEPGGYGKAVYITLGNGWVSVYAHLEKLYPELEKYCKTEQYKLMQFSVDLFPPKDSLKINRGDTIGVSGNTGASSGPHLHFEMRDEKTQTPVNICRYFDFPIFDTVPPVIEKLWIYPKQNTAHINTFPYKASFPIITKNSEAILKSDTNLFCWGNIGLGIEVYDPSDKTFNKTGVYKINFWFDDTLYFEQTFDKFQFSETRYVNSLIDYEYYISEYVRINKLFIQPNNKLSIYKNCKNNGIINIRDTLLHSVKIQVFDANNNSVNVNFKLKGQLLFPVKETDSVSDGDLINISCKSEQVYKNENIKVIFGSNSLYEDLPFLYMSLPKANGMYSDIHQVHNKYTPIHQPIILQISPNELPERLQDKAVIAYIDKNKPIWGSGSYKNGYIETAIRQFGNYAVTVDTIPPLIKPLFKLKKHPNFADEEQIGFKITDELTGISTFTGSIDGNWVLFEYDAKNDLLYYKFDPERMTFGAFHQLFLVVTDGKGNISEYKTEFIK